MFTHVSRSFLPVESPIWMVNPAGAGVQPAGPGSAESAQRPPGAAAVGSSGGPLAVPPMEVEMEKSSLNAG